jgi:hypothetical protein
VAAASYAIQTAIPTFNPPAGTYTGSQSVVISDATAGATVYYTLTGLTPTTASSKYSGPKAIVGIRSAFHVHVQVTQTASIDSATVPFAFDTSAGGIPPLEGPVPGQDVQGAYIPFKSNNASAQGSCGSK